MQLLSFLSVLSSIQPNGGPLGLQYVAVKITGNKVVPAVFTY